MKKSKLVKAGFGFFYVGNFLLITPYPTIVEGIPFKFVIIQL